VKSRLNECVCAYRGFRRGGLRGRPGGLHGGLRADGPGRRGRGVRPGLSRRRVRVVFGVRGLADRGRRHRQTCRRRDGRRRFRRGARLVTSGYITRV